MNSRMSACSSMIKMEAAGFPSSWGSLLLLGLLMPCKASRHCASGRMVDPSQPVDKTVHTGPGAVLHSIETVEDDEWEEPSISGIAAQYAL